MPRPAPAKDPKLRPVKARQVKAAVAEVGPIDTIEAVFARNSYNPLDELIKLSKDEEIPWPERRELHIYLAKYAYVQRSPEAGQGGPGGKVFNITLNS